MNKTPAPKIPGRTPSDRMAAVARAVLHAPKAEALAAGRKLASKRREA